MIQFPCTHLETYGANTKNDFYKEDYQRMFVKSPASQEAPAVKCLTEGTLGGADKKIGDKNTRKRLLGKKVAYHYQPSVKHPKNIDGEPSNDTLP